MILRRITEHVRAQNWFAVGLDFLIVVIGVFIGIQVANWNEVRQQRIDERDILERMSVEIESLIEVQQRELESNRVHASHMVSAHPVLFGQEPLRELTLAECETIAGSHVYSRPTDDLPVLDEVRESGRFDRLRDQELKSSLRAYLMVRDRTRGRYASVMNGLFRLYSRHPDVLWAERIPREADYDGVWTFLSGDGYRWSTVCNVAAMRESHAFLNEYMDNTARRSAMIEMYEERLYSLEHVREALRHALVQAGGSG